MENIYQLRSLIVYKAYFPSIPKVGPPTLQLNGLQKGWNKIEPG